MPVSILYSLAVFIFGLIIGSFLNVVILRLHSGESAVAGRSKCPECGHVLNWFDLFPVVSYVFLGGRCRYCKKEISWQYPLVEFITAILFVGAYYFDYYSGASVLVLARDIFAISALMVIFVYDLKWMIIPDQIALPAIVAIIIFNLLIGHSIGSLAVGLAVGLGFFGLQFLVSRGAWIGGGDLRLGSLLGVLLGWPLILVALFLAYMIGAGVAVYLMLRKKVTPKSQLPFGVFLAPSAIISLFWGAQILAWYLGRL